MLHDFRFGDFGSVTVLTPVTPAACDWVEEHIPAEATRWGDGIVIEPRYAGPIIEGINDDGLTVIASR